MDSSIFYFNQCLYDYKQGEEKGMLPGIDKKDL